MKFFILSLSNGVSREFILPNLRCFLGLFEIIKKVQHLSIILYKSLAFKTSNNFLESSFRNFEPWRFLVLQSDLKQGLKYLENKFSPVWSPKMLTLESVRTEMKPHEDMNPPAFLKRWYSSLAKRYILISWIRRMLRKQTLDLYCLNL
jgi:hypothetical protein